MEIAVATEAKNESTEDVIDERTRALRLIRSLVNIYRLCYAVAGSV
ncbi:MAG TPA: hypothetical protein V6C89_05875 [Drouetiella sp.]|jgi:hypothetical protein